MPIVISIFVLCIFFLVSGSKEEDASVLYYDSTAFNSVREAEEAEACESEADVEHPTPNAEVSEDAQSTDQIATRIAQGIYDDIEL